MQVEGASAQISVPIVDLGPLRTGGSGRAAVADRIGAACRESGFFYARDHGVDESLVHELEAASREFFALAPERKREIAMERGGRAWRGYFPVGGELTSGAPDQKEGIYFGSELSDDDPRVASGLPLHGRNLFPDEPRELRGAVLDYLTALEGLGHVLMEGIALSLDLDAAYFADRYTRDPLVLFRIFHYPPLAGGSSAWSVGEHTDYGLLTILWQSAQSGLQVKVRDRWIDAPPVPGTFVCNIGDMLDRMTGGMYRSTPHRVRNESGADRLSLAFFFDPGFETEIHPIEHAGAAPEDAQERWDGVSVRDLQGTYGDYLLGKVSKVFPELGRGVLPG